jgi:hypothetical protein
MLLIFAQRKEHPVDVKRLSGDPSVLSARQRSIIAILRPIYLNFIELKFFFGGNITGFLGIFYLFLILLPIVPVMV